jgi:hypothetical protein
MAALQQSLGNAALGKRDNFVHGALNVVECQAPMIIEGKLAKVRHFVYEIKFSVFSLFIFSNK